MCEDDSDCPFPQFPYCDGRLRYCVQCMDDRDCQFDAHCQFGGVCR